MNLHHLLPLGLILLFAGAGSCGGGSVVSYLDESRRIGGVSASEAETSSGRLAGGGDCGRGGMVIGAYCITPGTGTAILWLTAEGQYQLRVSGAWRACASLDDYSQWGELRSAGAYETFRAADAWRIAFYPADAAEHDGGSPPAISFTYTSDFLALSLCRPQPEDFSISGLGPYLYQRMP